MSISPIEAYGEPQLEIRFKREQRKAFYLDTTGKLVFGYRGSATDADQWFNKALST